MVFFPFWKELYMKTGFFAYKCMGWEENYFYWDFDTLKAFCRSSRPKLSCTPYLKLNPLPMAYIFSVTSFRLSHLPSHHQFNLLQLFMYSPTHIPTSHPPNNISAFSPTLSYPFYSSYGLQRAFFFFSRRLKDVEFLAFFILLSL